MTKLLSLLCLALILAGCVTSRPPNNTGFAHLGSLNELEGVYQNLGESESGTPPFYLSAVIWPKAVEIDHSAITAVEVRVINDHTLLARGIRKNGVEKEDTFVEGKDFEIASGRIRVKQGVQIAGFKADEPLVGPYYEGVELGLDQKRDGKYKHKFGVAGLVYCIIPIAMGGTEEVRFVRIGK